MQMGAVKVPADVDPAVRNREKSVFRRIRDQFVKNHRRVFGRLYAELKLRSAKGDFVRMFAEIRFELGQQDRFEIEAAPVGVAEHGEVPAHGAQASLESVHELIDRG